MSDNIKRIAFASMFAAMICALTMFPQIPTGFGGYVHLGDGVILIAGAFLGPYAALPAALGSMLADIASGYVLYAPATFVIKGCVGFIAGAMYKRGKEHALAQNLLAFSFAEIAMVAGYLAFEAFALGLEAALAATIPNLVQAAFGVTLSTLALRALARKFQL